MLVHNYTIPNLLWSVVVNGEHARKSCQTLCTLNCAQRQKYNYHYGPKVCWPQLKFNCSHSPTPWTGEVHRPLSHVPFSGMFSQVPIGHGASDRVPGHIGYNDISI